MIQIRSSSKAAVAAAAYCRAPARDVEAVTRMCTSCFTALHASQRIGSLRVGDPLVSAAPRKVNDQGSMLGLRRVIRGWQSVRLRKERWNV